MPTFSQQVDAINALIPETGTEITPQRVKQAIIIVAAGIAGESSIKFTATSSAGYVTRAELIGQVVSAVMIDDATKNTGFDQPDSDGKLVFNDGTTVSNGSVVTIFFA